MLFIKLTCPEDKKSKSAKKREVYISADKIRFMQKKRLHAVMHKPKSGLILKTALLSPKHRRKSFP